MFEKLFQGFAFVHIHLMIYFVAIYPSINYYRVINIYLCLTAIAFSDNFKNWT